MERKREIKDKKKGIIDQCSDWSSFNGFRALIGFFVDIFIRGLSFNNGFNKLCFYMGLVWIISCLASKTKVNYTF